MSTAAHSSTTESLVHELGAILDAILGPSDSVRKQAEQRLDELVAPTSGGGEALYGLALVGQGAAAYRPEVRTLALVLLRRLAFRPIAAAGGPAAAAAQQGETPFDRSPAHVLERTESCLLGTLEDETEPKIRKAAGEVVGRWAEESVKRGRECAPGGGATEQPQNEWSGRNPRQSGTLTRKPLLFAPRPCASTPSSAPLCRPARDLFVVTSPPGLPVTPAPSPLRSPSARSPDASMSGPATHPSYSLPGRINSLPLCRYGPPGIGFVGRPRLNACPFRVPPTAPRPLDPPA